MPTRSYKSYSNSCAILLWFSAFVWADLPGAFPGGSIRWHGHAQLHIDHRNLCWSLHFVWRQYHQHPAARQDLSLQTCIRGVSARSVFVRIDVIWQRTSMNFNDMLRWLVGWSIRWGFTPPFALACLWSMPRSNWRFNEYPQGCVGPV